MFQPGGAITFSRQRPDSTWGVWRAVDLGAEFGNATEFAEFGSSEVSIALTSAQGGLHGLITWHDSGALSDILLISRTSILNPWSTGAVASISTSLRDWDPWLSPDGRRVYFASEGHGGQGEAELLQATRTSAAAPFGTPVLLVELNSSASEGNPSLTEDELGIVFSSYRSGGGDVYFSSRASTSEPFGAPTLLPAVNTTRLEWETAISGDGCTVLFTRNGEIFLSRISPL